MLSQSVVWALVAGLLASLVGWFARQVMDERASRAPGDPRAELEETRVRCEAEAFRATSLARALDEALASAARRPRQVKELEDELTHHEGHIADLATELAERDRSIRKLEDELAGRARVADEISLDYHGAEQGKPREGAEAKPPQGPPEAAVLRR